MSGRLGGIFVDIGINRGSLRRSGQEAKAEARKIAKEIKTELDVIGESDLGMSAAGANAQKELRKAIKGIKSELSGARGPTGYGPLSATTREAAFRSRRMGAGGAAGIGLAGALGGAGVAGIAALASFAKRAVETGVGALDIS